MKALHDEVRCEVRRDCEPPDLEQTHQQARHEVAARGAEGRGADNVERPASLHSQHAKGVIVKSEAEEPRHQQTQQTNAEAGPADGRPGEFQVERNP